MGCFLGCFGGDKDRKRRKRRNKVIPRDQKHVGTDLPKNTISTEQRIAEGETQSWNLVSGERERSEETLNLSARKKVTFDSKVTTYEPVSVYNSTDSLLETKTASENEKEEGCGPRSSRSYSSSEEGSVISSVGSHPPNHRYHNCRDSDDEIEEFGDSDVDDEDDLDDDDDDDEDYGYCDGCFEGGAVGDQIWSESVLTTLSGSRAKESSPQVNEEVDSPLLIFGVPEQEGRKTEAKGYVRDRIHPVLNPVENLTQWKAVKSKAAAVHLKPPQKENFTAEVEGPCASFSLEPTFKQSSSGFRPKADQFKDNFFAVDASLSNWLGSPDTNPTKNTGSSRLEPVMSEKSISPGSNSVISFEDRPILGALTVEELKQFSASSSPRKSPSRSPDDMPIIGTVGTYWNLSGSGKDSGSATSFKGIPNSISKYREDKISFETRLERALKQGVA